MIVKPICARAESQCYRQQLGIVKNRQRAETAVPAAQCVLLFVEIELADGTIRDDYVSPVGVCGIQDRDCQE